MVNNKNLFDYRCWINNAGEYIANAKNFPPVVKVVASLQNFDCRLCEEVISTNVKKNPQYGLLITAIYDKDWIVDTAKKYNNELSDDTIMETFSTGFIQFGETVFCEVHEVLGKVQGCAQCYDLRILVAYNAKMDWYELSVFVPVEEDAITTFPDILQRYKLAIRQIEKYLDTNAYGAKAKRFVKNTVTPYKEQN